MMGSLLGCLLLSSFWALYTAAPPPTHCYDASSKIDLTKIPAGSFDIYESFAGMRTLYKWDFGWCTPLSVNGNCPPAWITGQYKQESNICYAEIGNPGTLPTLDMAPPNELTLIHQNNNLWGKIKIVCDEGGAANTIQPDGDVIYSSSFNPVWTQTYDFTMKSKCACSNGCWSGGGGLSIGDGLLIVLLVLVVVYLGGGMLFMYKRRDVRGFDMIPHKQFWMDLPGLVKDGVLWTYTKVVKRQDYIPM